MQLAVFISSRRNTHPTDIQVWMYNRLLSLMYSGLTHVKSLDKGYSPVELCRTKCLVFSTMQLVVLIL